MLFLTHNIGQPFDQNLSYAFPTGTRDRTGA